MTDIAYNRPEHIAERSGKGVLCLISGDHGYQEKVGYELYVFCCLFPVDAIGRMLPHDLPFKPILCILLPARAFGKDPFAGSDEQTGIFGNEMVVGR